MLTTPNPPAGLEAIGPAFHRATRLAKALFGALDSLIVLAAADGKVWRSRDRGDLPPKDPWASQVLATGEPIWIEDLGGRPEYADFGVVKGPLKLRFYAAAPIRLADGSFGALCVVAREPRPPDEKLQARLQDIADTVADECDRARAILAERRSAAEAATAVDVLSTLINTLPLGLVMTDREMRVLKAGPLWAKHFGLTEAEVVGRTLYEVSPYFEQFKHLHQEVLQGARHNHPRLGYERNGRIQYVHTQLIPWRDGAGEIGGLLITAQGVTEMVEAMEKVERSEQRLKLALELADLQVWEADINRRTLETVGDVSVFFDRPLTFDQLAEDAFVSIHPDDVPLAKARLRQRASGAAPTTPFECRTRRSDGKEVWCSQSIEVIHAEDGRPQRILGVMQNITPRKEAEKALTEALEEARRSAAETQAAQQVLSLFIETIPVAVVMTDRDMNVIKASPRWMNYFGVSNEREVIGRNLYEIEPGLKSFEESHDRCLAGETIHNPRLKTLDRDGQAMYLETDLIPWRAPSGDVGGMLISVHNITPTVEAMRNLERSERRLQMAVKLADLHAWEMDYGRKTLDHIGDYRVFFDEPMKFEDLMTDPLSVVHPDDRARAATRMARRYAGGASEEGEPLEARLNRDDKEVWASFALEPVFDTEGKVQRVVGVMQNITPRKKSERALIEARDAAEAANRAKSEFLANMSHEIRTPLNGILGMAQVIEQDELSDVQRDRIKVVRDSGATLLAILNDVLDLSKIQAGKLELNLADFDMAELAPVVAAAFEGSAAAKDLALRVEVDDSAGGPWIGDVLRLRQVLSNLVSNALKFTSQGAVTLAVRHDGQAMVFSVRDTGIGIESGKIALLFDKFSQADASTTRRYGGTGLGLAISRELVELMGGRIEVESEKDVGSCFSVIVPLERGKARPAAPAPEDRGAVRGDLSAVSILAAEDNPTNQLVLRSLLQPLGVSITMAPDGREAVAAFRRERFDIVLMDVQMPEMNGVEATAAIRRLEAEQGLGHTPILALSANVMTHQIADYLSCGMDGCIAKPIEVEKLYAALEEALQMREERSEAAA